MARFTCILQNKRIILNTKHNNNQKNLKIDQVKKSPIFKYRFTIGLKKIKTV